MKTIGTRRMVASLAILAGSLLGFLASAGAAAEKLKPEDIAAGNLASIGTPEARAAAKTRAVEGSVHMIARRGAAMDITGGAMLVSEGHNSRLGINFPSPNYPGEQIAFDGSEVTTAQIRPGLRSIFSEFIHNCETPVREGLFTGALSEAWALADTAGRQPKLEYGGLKKIGGRQLHELKYKPRQSSCDISISLYFEPDTFRHVRSQYKLTRPPDRPTNFQTPTAQGDTVYTITEEYSDFKTVDALTLPHTYKLNMSIEGPTSTYLADWTLTVSKITHNQPVDPKVYGIR